MNNIMKVSEEQDVRLIEIEGKLDADSSPDLEALLSEQDSLKSKKTIINLEKVSVVTADGVRVLINASMSSEAGQLSLKNPNETVEQLMKTVGLDSLIET